MKDITQMELIEFGYGIDHKIHPQLILDLFKKMGETTQLKLTNIIQGKKTCPTSCPIPSTLYNQSYMCKSLSQYSKLSDKIKKNLKH